MSNWRESELREEREWREDTAREREEYAWRWERRMIWLAIATCSAFVANALVDWL
jgi:hypothetical protein